MPALWTAVLGEHDRTHESGHEQRIPVEKIVMHEKYHHFKHDIVLMKLSRPAKISISSQVAKICLPFANLNFSPSSHSNQQYNLHNKGDASSYSGSDVDDDHDDDDDDLNQHESMGIEDNGNNYLRSFRQGRTINKNRQELSLPKVKGTARQHVVKLVNDMLHQQRIARGRSSSRAMRTIDRRRNDKFASGFFSTKRFGPWNRDIQMEVNPLLNINEN